MTSLCALFLVQSLSIASLSTTGGPANGDSDECRVSRDGRFVAFRSYASNLVAGDTNGFADLFVRELAAGQTTRVNVSSAGAQANNSMRGLAISRDGRYVAFSSDASNLVPGDTNLQTDVFVRDRQAGTTTRVSVSSSGGEANGQSGGNGSIGISGDGRFVAFHSSASNLVAGDTNGADDVFVRDRATGVTTRESVATGGEQGDHFSFEAAISADGRYVVFASSCSNFVPGLPGNGWVQIYRRDRLTGELVLISANNLGDPGNPFANQNCYTPAVSDDGNRVIFTTPGSTLVDGDTNISADVFLRDVAAGTTTAVSVDPSGNVGNFQSQLFPSISGDGRYAIFASSATTLTSGLSGSGNVRHWFRRDLLTSQTELLSKTPAGTAGNATAGSPIDFCGISENGQVLAFPSNASNLVAGDTNGQPDVFVRRSAPAIATVTPACGPLAGGTTLTLAGQGLGGATVTVGGAPATSVTLLSDSKLTCVTPAGAAGEADVVASTSVGSTTAAGAFTYTANLAVFGTGTPGCLGMQEIAATSPPAVGHAFDLRTEKAPALSLGLALIADAQDLAGSDPFGLGVLLHVNFFAATTVYAFDALSDVDGVGSTALAVPALPSLAGSVWFAQTLWAWTSCALPPYGLSTSRGLRFTVVP